MANVKADDATVCSSGDSGAESKFGVSSPVCSFCVPADVLLLCKVTCPRFGKRDVPTKAAQHAAVVGQQEDGFASHSNGLNRNSRVLISSFVKVLKTRVRSMSVAAFAETFASNAAI